MCIHRVMFCCSVCVYVYSFLSIFQFFMFFFILMRRPCRSTLFPYTTLFRSTPTGSQAGIWMAGAAPLFDSSGAAPAIQDRKSTRLNSSHTVISYAVFCLKKKKNQKPYEYLLRVTPHRCIRNRHSTDTCNNHR